MEKYCPKCKQQKEGVEQRRDPFIYEIHGKIVYQIMCGDCEEALHLDT